MLMTALFGSDTPPRVISGFSLVWGFMNGEANLNSQRRFVAIDAVKGGNGTVTPSQTG